MQFLLITGGVIAALGLLLFVMTLVRLKQKQWGSVVTKGTSSIIVLSVGGVVLLAGSNLATYQRLTYEAPVAQVYFEQLAANKFRVEVYNEQTGSRDSYEVLGDEWQLDAQILTWHGAMTMLGLDAQYRLIRLSGRYADINQEKATAKSVHALAPVKSYDVWTNVQKYQRWIKWVDATYGSAVFLPMVDEALFRVSISRTGLVARPENAVARDATRNWSGL